MKDPRLPSPAIGVEYARRLTHRLYGLFNEIWRSLDEVTHTGTSAPTTGLWKQGDFVRNSAAVEQGTAGSKYVVIGWICVTSGEPGTWQQCRCLTGN